MTKTDMVAQIAREKNLTKSDVEGVIDAFLETIGDTLKSGNEVRLVGFGTFLTRARAASTARNPQTGAPVAVPASTVAVFRVGKVLKAKVNS